MNKRLVIAALVVGTLSATSLYAATNISTVKEKAIKKATEQVPANSQMLMAVDKGSYSKVKFYNKDKDETYEVEIDHTTQGVKEFKSEKVSLRGSNTIKLNNEAIKKIVLKEYPNAEILNISLDKGGWLQEYEVTLTNDNMIGELEINPETGVILKRDFESMDAHGQGIIQIPAVKDPINSTFISIEKVQDITLSKIPGSTITDIDLDTKFGRNIYKVEAFKDGYEYELVLDAETGKGLALSKELEEWYKQGISEGDLISTPPTAISLEKAKTIALNKVPGSSIVKVEQDYDDGRLVYEMELRKGKLEYDLEIDGLTGQILDFEIDD